MKATRSPIDSDAQALYAQIQRGLLSPAEAAERIAAFRARVSADREAAPPREVFSGDEPCLRDHTLGGKPVLIGVTHASLALNEYFRRHPGDASVSLRQLGFVKPVEIGPAGQAEVQVVEDSAAGPDAFAVRFRLAASAAWQVTAKGRLRGSEAAFDRQDLAALKAGSAPVADLRVIYDAGEPFFKVGPSFRVIRQLFHRADAALAELDLAAAIGAQPREYHLPPVILYSAFSALIPLLEPAGFRYAFLPFGIQTLDYRKGFDLTQAWVAVRLVKRTEELVFFDADVLTPRGEEVALCRGCSIKRLRLDAEPATPIVALEPRPIQPVAIDADGARAAQTYLLEALGIPRGGASLDKNLMELGLASARLVELAGKIGAEKGVSLDPTLFFEYPTIRELARYFVENHPACFAAAPSEPPRQAAVQDRPAPAVTPATVRAVRPAGLPPDARLTEGIAVIGMAGRFAGAANVEQFWENLRGEKEVIGEIPRDHWDYRPWFDENPETPDKTYCKWGSFIEGVDRFDPAFFDIPPGEACWLDPQVRLLLQSVYAAAEHAGVVNRVRHTATGVFMGICSADYQERIAELRLPVDPGRTGVGGGETAANRVSYWLGLSGPSLVFNTACSSSLFALHYACKAILRGECEQAFVAGANLLLSSRHYRHFAAIRALSPTGRCRPFDRAADGYVPGECVATVLLKPLAQAMRDRDPIHAVIRGSAALHAGRAPSLTAPSVSGQENTLLKAWADAGIDPRTLSYIECHGTGTQLGDSIELAALRKALDRFNAPVKACGVGSVKANLGHTEGAAGLAGLIKVILQMKHREIPGLPHFEQPNEHLRLENSPLFIQAKSASWEPHDGPLRAGVSAFGFSGSYAHVVVESAPPRTSTPPSARAGAVPIVLSAKTGERLREGVQNLLQFLQTAPDANLASIAYTLQTGREPLAERLAFTADSMADLRTQLAACAAVGAANSPCFRGQVEADNQALIGLAADEDMAATFQAWFQKGKYARLLELWVRGCDFDWEKLRGDDRPERVALPTYPFARERYWIPEADEPDVPASPAAISAEASRPEVSATWRFSLLSPGANPARPALAPEAKAVLILRQMAAAQMRCPMAAVNAASAFLELPLGSLGLVELVRAVGDLLEESLSPALLFEYANLAGFAAFLAREYSAKLDRVNVSQTEVPPPDAAAADSGICPLSEGQLGLWALQKAAPDMTAYNCPLGFRVNAPLDISCFENACRFLLRQHPLLAARIEEGGGAPVFVSRPADSFELRRVDAAGWSESQVRAWLERAIKTPFDLAKDAFLRASLLTISSRETVVLFTVHHLVFDGSSFPLFLRTLLDAYHQLRQGRPPELTSGAATYRDYALAERRLLTGREGARRLAFWREQLAGERVPLEMPLDFPRSAARPFAGRTVSTRLPADLLRRLKTFGKAQALYESTLFLTVFKELLRLYSGQTDLIVGMPVNERSEGRFQSLIGYFVNLVPIRSRAGEGQPFAEFARSIQRTMLAALANRYSFPALVRELKLSGQGTHPVFQAAFEYQNFLRPDDVNAVRQAAENAFPMTWIEGLRQEGEYELALEVVEEAEGCQLNLKYNPTLLREATAARMVAQLAMLLETALANPQRAPAAERLLSQAERATLERWNQTRCDYPRDACIHHFFEDQARRNPRAIAATFDDKELTYRELDERSTRLALRLQRLGVRPDAIVGLCLERSLEMIVAILGVLKAGGAYLPLDPDYPEERLAFMVGDSQTAWILSQSRLAGKVAKIKGATAQVLFLDRRGMAGGAPLKGALKREVGARHLAYALYTSGSTGTPKGVLVEHRALCNRIVWMQREYNLGAADRVLQKTPFSFDVSGWEFHWPLLAGARLVFAAPGKHKDPEYLRDLIQARGITVLHFVPSMLQAFLAAIQTGECGGLRQVFCSGEELTPGQVARFYERFDHAPLHNLYGPTEAAIDVSYKHCERGAAKVTIGKPIANARLHVLDAQLRLLPVGFPGELCIAGDALARGYLNRPDLTADRFVNHPFEPGAKLYRTGDLARWTPEGEIEYLGRLDHQVKLRGCRIELGEIEAAMAGLPGIREAVVAPQGEGNDKKLAAFYVASGGALPPSWFRERLKQQLPEHMIPAVFASLDRLPLTASGKVDRRCLSQRPVAAVTPAADDSPRTPTQTRLLALWREALALETIGMRESFFDLGGHSLSALSLMAKINAAFHAQLPLATLFEAKCIADLAARLDVGDTGKADAYLAVLESRGTQPPLCLVPGIGGGSFSFLPLSRALGENQPMFQFQPPGLQGEREPLDTIQQLAAFYIERLPRPASKGGYRLGGWSMGGVVAYEMACQLTGRGLPVDRLFLIDSYLPEHFERFAKRASAAGEKGGRPAAYPTQLSPELATGDSAITPHIAAVLAAHQRALASYRPTQVFDGEVLYVCATESAAAAVEDAGAIRRSATNGGWIQETRRVWIKYLPCLVRQPGRFVTVRATHESILRDPAVSQVAGELLAWDGPAAGARKRSYRSRQG
jgi:amino acid adenylation domain-containing protein